MSFRVAADIGGTFTDVAVADSEGNLHTFKLKSTPHDYSEAVFDGIKAAAGLAGVEISSFDQILHTCTVATNAILENKGARTALVTTKGFRDVLELRRIRVPKLYEPLYVKPRPLVPRRYRYEIPERIDAAGNVITPIDENAITDLIDQLQVESFEAIAICFINAYVNSDNEQLVGRRIQDAFPECFVTLSSDVLPQIREYERTSSTVINGYVGPPVRRYLGSLKDKLEAAGVQSQIMVMRSGGGLCDLEAAMNGPAHIVECGPAAGVIGAARHGARCGLDRLLTLDMGGTTAKASIVEFGEVQRAEDFEVGGGISLSGPLVMGGGYALKIPVVDVAEVGAGGGSIVHLDAGGLIRVGPESAGPTPGPICYGNGGDKVTVTDANVVLGYLNPTAMASGRVTINGALSRSQISEQIANPLDQSYLASAYGIHVVANALMMRAIKTVSTYRGRDPRDFSLLAFGGCGGVHAVGLAQALGMREVVIPPAAGIFSALGLLLADIEIEHSSAFLVRTHDIKLVTLTQAIRRLEEKVLVELDRDRSQISFERYLDMRFVGQAYELSVPLPDGEINQDDIDGLSKAFVASHVSTYGHAGEGKNAVQAVTLRVKGIALLPELEKFKQKQLTLVRVSDTELPQHDRSVYFGPALGEVNTPIIDRSDLDIRSRSGPFVIEESECTSLVPPDCSAALDEYGNIRIEVKAN